MHQINTVQYRVIRKVEPCSSPTLHDAISRCMFDVKVTHLKQLNGAEAMPLMCNQKIQYNFEFMAGSYGVKPLNTFKHFLWAFSRQISTGGVVT